MFDVAGVVSLEGPLVRTPDLKSAFSAEPWERLTAKVVEFVESPHWRVSMLHRPLEPADVATRDGKVLFLLGHAFRRWDVPASSDLETGQLSAQAILTAYLQRGTALLQMIKGNFTLVFLDKQTLEHRIMVSRLAISPLYYTVAGTEFYFSTNVGAIVKLLQTRPPLDCAAVLETMLFNFPMRERTFFEGIYRVPQGSVITISRHGVHTEIYWDHARFYESEKLPVQEAHEIGSELFFRSVNELAAARPRICASFTAGFDSRALHAVLQKDRQDVLSYSFGIRGSLNVSIPQRICAHLGYPFKPIYLDDEFEAVFDRYAWRTVILSDGLVIQRANYPYAFEQIAEFAPVVLTGLFGSEFLRTFQNLGTVVSQDFARLNQADNIKVALREAIRRVATDSYLSRDLVESAHDKVEADCENWFARYRLMAPDRRFYMYLLTEVDRKYFAAEVSTERIYAANQFPFLDEEFVQFIFRAPFAGVYSHTITPTVTNRFNSQHFYAFLIRKYRPELLPYPTDHGYPPGHLLKPMPLLWVGGSHLWSRLRRRITHYREFRPDKWLSTFYRQNESRVLWDSGIYSPRFHKHLVTGEYLDYLVDFDKVAALQLWLCYLDGNMPEVE